MPSPFPGMDPYLESPDIWPDVHHELISQIQGVLNRKLRPNYVARIKVRAYESDERELMGVEIKEARLEIQRTPSLLPVAVIEVLRHANKMDGSRGRAVYLADRNQDQQRDLHTIEIDLLRAGCSPTLTRGSRGDYRVVIDVFGRRLMRPMHLREPLPIIGIPVGGDDPDVALDLQKVLTAAYDHAAYERSIDYTKDADSPLAGADRIWANKLLRERGRR